MSPRPPTEPEMLSYFKSLSNWGRWGTDDELGTLNLISAEKRRDAAASVREGLVLGCARPIRLEPPTSDVPRPPLHFMITSGESRVYPPVAEGEPPYPLTASDFIGLAPHGGTVTHLDALSHFFWEGQMYNGRPSEMVSGARGATACSVEALRDGIVTRGVLLDIAQLRGKPYLEKGEGIFVEDLEAAEKAHGVRVEEGDALLIRTGWYRRRVELGPSQPRVHRPGLHVETLPWLAERGVALVASDAPMEVVPSGYPSLLLPFHNIAIVAMGMCLIDNCQFEQLATECARLGRWTFLFTVAPLRFERATASPVTPLALL